jgi:hypothetical protein
MRITFLASGLLLLLSACGSSSGSGVSDPGPPYSCTVTVFECIDLQGSVYTGASATTTQATCTGLASGSTFNDGADCPTENLVGSCFVNNGESNQYTFRYYSGSGSPTPNSAAAQSICSGIGGSFTAD